MKSLAFILVPAFMMVSANGRTSVYIGENDIFEDTLTVTISSENEKMNPMIFHRENQPSRTSSYITSTSQRGIPSMNTDRFFYGRSDDAKVANFLKMEDSSKFVGSIVDEKTGMIYQISPDAEGVLQMRENHASNFEPEEDPDDFVELTDSRDDIDRRTKNVIGNKRLLEKDDRIVTLDVMVVWTKNSECTYSGLQKGCTLTTTTAENMMALVELAVMETNIAYENSGVLIQLRLAHAYRHPDFNEDFFSFVDSLQALRLQKDGIMDDVHVKRDLYHADIVAMLSNLNTSCGVGYVGPSKAWMFSVTNYRCATGNFSFGHEIGHNLGCRHDRGTENSCDDEDNHDYGYRDPQSRFRSIMAYNCRTDQCDNNQGTFCTRVQKFSNVEYLHNGAPIGDEKNNNVLQMNNVRAQVSSYFVTPPSESPTLFPSIVPSKKPTSSSSPSTVSSTIPTLSPSSVPSTIPTLSPSTLPSTIPTLSLSSVPSTIPTLSPSTLPSTTPTLSPSTSPSEKPTSLPSANPSLSPSTLPSTIPSLSPSSFEKSALLRSSTPSFIPSMEPSAQQLNNTSCRGQESLLEVILKRVSTTMN